MRICCLQNKFVWWEVAGPLGFEPRACGSGGRRHVQTRPRTRPSENYRYEYIIATTKSTATNAM